MLVTGASGTLGSAVVPRLQKQGYAVRPMTRSARAGWVTADLRTGDGLAEAVRGVDVIVHLASAPGRPQKTDVEGTRRLMAAARNAGVGHVLYVSIVGIDRVPYPYYRAKLDTEKVVEGSGVPHTIVRATQFHQFAEMLLSALSKPGPVIIDPSWQVQPLDVEDLAEEIAELIGRPAAGKAIEYGGPQVLTFDDLARSWLAARGRKRPIWRLGIPGKVSRALRAGALTTSATPTGSRTWRDYLAEKY
ncbi:nucleotide-diphosphate-sugar epimerase [Paractinoplanes tereljensis]|uniref:Nucleotide-diphosphate-sugar epimerase n=1 Tax=Paractinoplanes tereljensis TaxID=571912 RepID=A0A919NWC5_9ACTN|nr:nucleotide-diphosphate-sugar epimerase [Actinoplanes tereljensis]